jgi:hypothetical protein
MQVAHACCHVMQHLQPPVPVEVRHILQAHDTHAGNTAVSGGMQGECWGCSVGSALCRSHQVTVLGTNNAAGSSNRSVLRPA